MSNNPWFTLAWIVGSCIELAICIVLARRSLLSRWRFLFAYCCSSLIFDIVLSVSRSHYATYFYAYWTWVFLASFLRLAIFADVIESFPGRELFGGRARVIVTVASILLGFAAWMIARRSSHVFASDILASAVILDRCATFACATAATVFVLGLRTSSLGWSRRAVMVTAGIAVQLVGYLLSLHFLTRHSDLARTIGGLVLSLSTLIAAGVWLSAFVTKDHSTEFVSQFSLRFGQQRRTAR